MGGGVDGRVFGGGEGEVRGGDLVMGWGGEGVWEVVGGGFFGGGIWLV